MPAARPLREDPRDPRARAASARPTVVPDRPAEAPGRPVVVPVRPSPPRARPDPNALRTLVAFAGIASASAIVTALLPSIVPASDAATVDPGAGQVALVDTVPTPSVRHVRRVVVLKPGQTAPPKATVIVRPTPTPRVHVVTRTRQSGKP